MSGIGCASVFGAVFTIEADLDALRAATSPRAFWPARPDLTREALARDSAVAEADIAAVEQGEPMAEPALYDRLAQVLDVDVEDLRAEEP